MIVRLTNTQYDELMRSYSRRQSENERDLGLRRAKAYAKIPELSRLDEEAALCAVESAKARFSRDSEQADRLKERIRAVARERCALLRAHGLPDDYLNMHYHCPDCRDTGYIGSSRCHCFMQQAVDLFYTQSGLRAVLEEENFSRFRLEYYPDSTVLPGTGLTPRKNAERVLAAVKNFTAGFSHSADAESSYPGNLFLYGGTGLGKTFLSHCIAKELLDRAFSVVYYSAYDLFEMLAEEAFGKNRSQEMKDPFSDLLTECDLLIIDDLGTEMTNSFVASSLFQLLNTRILKKRSVLISTNLSLSAFADTYTERVFSRITSCFTLLGLYGDDIRIQKALKNRQLQINK